MNELGDWLAAEIYPQISLPKNGPDRNPGRAYRVKQIFKWLGRGVQSFDEMTNLPGDLREQLAARAITGIPMIIAETRSPRDGTVKYGMKTFDGCVVESVLMRYRQGYSVCVSSQAGCRMGCAFCATKPQNFARHLSPGEMFGQVVVIARQVAAAAGHITTNNGQGAAAAGQGAVGIGQVAATAGHKNELPTKNRKAEAKGMPKIRNIVVMGVGEPFDNYDNTLKFIRLLHDHEETNIGYRRITISTCGILPGILRLAEEGLPIGLAVSLHASNDRVRSMIIPVNNRYSIDKLIEGCKIYTYKTNRRVTFEYALMNGINDAPDDAIELLSRIRGMLCHVNLIPVNKTENTGFIPSSKEKIARFGDILAKGGVQATVRRGLGTDIMAACGQLRNSMIE